MFLSPEAKILVSPSSLEELLIIGGVIARFPPDVIFDRVKMLTMITSLAEVHHQ